MKSHSMWIFGALLVCLTGLVACGESGKGNSAANNPAVAACTLPGQVYIGSYGGVNYNTCFSNTTCSQYGANYAYIPQLNQCIPGTVGGGGGYVGTGNRHLWSGYVVFTGGGQGAYREMIKDNGICQGGHLASLNYMNCEQWDDNAEVAFEIMSNGVLPANSFVDVTAYSDRNAYYPLQFTYQAQATPINTNTAFSMRTLNGGTGFNKYFEAVGSVGALISGSTLVPQYRLTLKYNEQEIGYAYVTLRY